MSITVDFVKIDEARFLEVCRLYHKWKSLNNAIKSWTSRGLNFPDVISEQMVCFALGLKWNKGTKGGDATDKNGALIEIKASSNFDSDLSSFSPKTKFDKLIFLRLNQDDDTALVYDMGFNGESFKALKVNHNETVSDHQKAGRRPRLRLIEIIEKNNILPLCKIDIVAMKII